MNTRENGVLSLPRLIASLAIGVAVGWLAQHFLLNRGGETPPASPGWVAREPVALPGVQPELQPDAAQTLLDVALRLPDDPVPVGDDKVALPAGTRFFVEAQATQAGVLTVSTSRGDAAPTGEPLWTSEVLPGAKVHSPAMRLEGPKGLEHLHLVLRDAQGREIARKRLDIWHQ